MMMIRKIVRRNKDKLDTSRARTSKIDGRNHMRHKCMPHNIGSPPNLLQYALFPSQKKPHPVWFCAGGNGSISLSSETILLYMSLVCEML